MSKTATIYADTIHRWIGNGDKNVIKTFYPLAATTYTYGQFVTIATTGRVTNNATDDVAIDGIVMANVDNSLGAADNTDKMVPVLVYGTCWVDCFQQVSGQTYDDALTIGLACSVGGDAGTTVAEGQAVVGTSTLSNKNFTSLSIQAIPVTASGEIDWIRIGYFLFRGNGKWY